MIACSGCSPHGQGHETTFAQIVAERLGIDPGDVELRFGEIPGVGTYASRSVAMGGSALGLASEQILAQATAAAARLLHCRAEELVRAGRDWTAPDGRTVCWGEAAAGLEAEVRFESELVFGSGAYAAVVRDRRGYRHAARATPGGGRRCRDDHQSAARRGPGARRGACRDWEPC